MEERKSRQNIFVLTIGALVAIILALLVAFFALISKHVEKNEQMIANLTQELKAVKEQTPKQSSQINASDLVNALNELKAQEIRDALNVKKDNYAQALPKEQVNNRRLYGNPNARFTLAVYSDTECPYCKRFHHTPKRLVESSNGQINWEFIHLPLSFHNPAAEAQAVAAECVYELVGNQMFWVFLDDVFAKTRGNAAGVEDLTKVALETGVNKNDFLKCMATSDANQKVTEDLKKASSLGIRGTPGTVILDNQTGRSQILSGAQPPEAIMSVIRGMVEVSQGQ